jgi:alkanesulfonate monooxygenase SsuD/methylene tetrahydromethanopterin reductase-like flavin-dependent oxidoreductase (luciferase family)
LVIDYRHPAILVKSVSTLDVLSGGRAYFGIGAAWYEREAVGLGIPFPSWQERFERLEETLQITKQMWRGEVGPFQGKHYTLAETLNNPTIEPAASPDPDRGMREEDAAPQRNTAMRVTWVCMPGDVLRSKSNVNAIAMVGRRAD